MYGGVPPAALTDILPKPPQTASLSLAPTLTKYDEPQLPSLTVIDTTLGGPKICQLLKGGYDGSLFIKIVVGEYPVNVHCDGVDPVFQYKRY